MAFGWNSGPMEPGLEPVSAGTKCGNCGRPVRPIYPPPAGMDLNDPPWEHATGSVLCPPMNARPELPVASYPADPAQDGADALTDLVTFATAADTFLGNIDESTEAMDETLGGISAATARMAIALERLARSSERQTLALERMQDHAQFGPGW